MTQKACRGHVVPVMRRFAHLASLILLVVFIFATTESSAQPQALNGSGVVIGIYDSGVNLDHSSFQNNNRSRIVSQYCLGDSTDVNPCDADSLRLVQNNCDTLEVGCYHGNSVAGFAAGSSREVNIKGKTKQIGGIASNAELSYVREAMDSDGTIPYSNFVAALEKFVSDVESNSSAAPDVVNLSLSFPRDSYQDCEADTSAKRAIDTLVENGVVVVAAAGNESDKTQISYPACMNNVIAVGSTTKKGDTNRVSDFSNSSDEVDIVAPGDNVLGVLPQEQKFANVSGTSFAAPLISGAVALIKQAKPELLHSEVLQILQSSGDDVVDPATGQVFKLLNVDNVIESVKSQQAKVENRDVSASNNMNLDLQTLEISGSPNVLNASMQADSVKILALGHASGEGWLSLLVVAPFLVLVILLFRKNPFKSRVSSIK